MIEMGPRWRLTRRAATSAMAGFPLAAVRTEVLGAALPLRAIATGDSPSMRAVVESLRSRFQNLQIVRDASEARTLRGNALNLAIGPTALQIGLATELQGPLVGLFVSRQSYERLINAAAIGQHEHTTAIYAEASIGAQMLLIARLFQRHVSVGVLLTDTTANLEADLQREARRTGLKLRIRKGSRAASVVRDVAALASEDVLLAVPDATIYNSETLPAVLESTYRRNQPVIGFSPALVNAGTLATAHADLGDVLATLDVLRPDLEAGRTPDPTYPHFWRVAVNETVAKSLNILVSDEARSLGVRPPVKGR